MSRIAWYSNACHIPSGYGMQTAQVVHQMVKDGHEVAVTANHGAAVMMNCAHGHPIFPEGLMRYSIDAAPDNMKAWVGDQPGFGVTLFDVWPLQGVQGFADQNLACWVPIDHEPAPPAVIKFLKDGGHHAIAMSRFGEKMLANAGISNKDITYIPRLVAHLGIDPQRVRYPHPVHFRNGIPQDAIAAMYSAADVQLLTSMGEGFGIPAIESQACGTPVIVSDFSAQPELVGAHGIKVPVQRVWDEYQASFFGIPNVSAITAALRQLYEETKGGRVDRAAVSASMEQYDQTKLYDASWKPLIKFMTERKRPTSAPLNRAQRRAAKTK